MANAILFNLRKFGGAIHRSMYSRFSSSNKRLTSVFEYKDVSYVPDANLKHKFDIYVPAGSGERMFPILVYFHGGDYLTGDKVYSSKIAKKLASLGMVVFNVNYSLTPNYNMAQIEADVQLAIEEAMTIAVLHNGDYEATFVGGDGVGAGLASRVVANIKNDKYSEYLKDYILGVIGISGRYDLSKMANSKSSMEKGIVESLLHNLDNMPAYFDAVKYINSKFPNALIITSTGDKYMDESREFVDILKKKKVKHTYLCIETNDKKTTLDSVCGKEPKAYNTLTISTKAYLNKILNPE